jgi:hypothetical protein
MDWSVLPGCARNDTPSGTSFSRHLLKLKAYYVRCLGVDFASVYRGRGREMAKKCELSELIAGHPA